MLLFGEMTLDQLAAYLRRREKLTLKEEQQLLADRRQGARQLLDSFRRRAKKLREEKKRLHNMACLERALQAQGFEVVAGVDEAGRGPLAGPVVAAAVILPRETFPEGLNDSKRLTSRQREMLFEDISRIAVGIGVGIGSVELIDRINIFGATMEAMAEAVYNLPQLPSAVLVDGYPIRGLNLYQQAVIGGDARSLCIAAASVVAKVTRDRLMDRLHQAYPQYGFDRHRGYATSEHREALQKYGFSPVHRRSFRLRLPADLVINR